MSFSGWSSSALKTRLSETLSQILMINSQCFAMHRRFLCFVRNSVMCTAFADLDFRVSIVLGSVHVPKCFCVCGGIFSFAQ